MLHTSQWLFLSSTNFISTTCLRQILNIILSLWASLSCHSWRLAVAALLCSCKQSTCEWNKTSSFRTLFENTYHPELCEGLHQNERSHFVRSVSLSKQSCSCIGERSTILQVPRFDLDLDCLLPKNELILYTQCWIQFPSHIQHYPFPKRPSRWSQRSLLCDLCSITLSTVSKVLRSYTSNVLDLYKTRNLFFRC